MHAFWARRAASGGGISGVFCRLFAALPRLTQAFATALRDPEFLREAQRQFMPLNPLIGAEYRAMAQRTEDNLRALWQRRPWRE